ncbi:hypothetical protein M1P56_17510 [Streptomyces sp. HU2014]|uniref:hypothetical protein n=1 Tax=Streptomyces sp. HU2014 TaxID=2939414 RepID=UPI00200DF269|nr:hypothetical protein [Streptomyces sp. HU2014]UQI46019.1 hypothetical protein M1P56_17510 [Streptomyces sp. HU2014]
MNIARPVAIAAAAALLGGGLLLAPSATATPATGTQAAPTAELLSCSHSWSNKDADKEKVTKSGVRYRVGPHTSCAALGQIDKGATVYFHCYTRTQDDGTWSHVRIKGTDRQGWVKDTLIDGGSQKLC